jgi:predicted Zn-dependent protease
MKACWRPSIVAAMLGCILAGCAVGTAQAPPSSPQVAQPAGGPRAVQVDGAQAQRLQRIMSPLIQHMDHPIPLSQVRVAIMADPQINAANAGGGEFYVTTGLLQSANDDQLRAVLAHETAHADLGHVAKSQALATGLDIGSVLLGQIFPSTRALTPIAGQLVANAYTRSEESAADAHGVEILRRAGYDGKTLMVNTLTWLEQTEGNSGGGFFATHPATADRVQAVQRMP